MKKIIIKILIISVIFLNIWFISNAYAEETTWITVTVTEKIPGAWCTEIKNDKGKITWYTCTVEKWFWSVVTMMWGIIKYFTFIAWLFGVLFIIVNGIMYSMWWIDASMKDEAKKRITGTIIWLILLLLSWVILNMIAPWIYV